MEKQISRRRRIYQIVEIGGAQDPVSRGYDFFSAGILLLNVLVSILFTFDRIELRCGAALNVIEQITVAFFALDYALRLLTADLAHPHMNRRRALKKYIFSFYGIIDLLSFLPFYLPVFFPRGIAVFRLIRIIRIFRLFRLNTYYDSLNVITEVLSSKKQQLFSSVAIILILMLGASLCMYSIEHDAQPEVFENALSGIWWSVSTLLTVGYGDIYPVTPLGRLFGTVITFLGVGIVAIPTGIISAGFVEQYTRLKELGDMNKAEDVSFIRIDLKTTDEWNGKEIRQLSIPRDAIIALILRGEETVVPRGDTVLLAGDVVILGSGRAENCSPIQLQSITVGEHSHWRDRPVKDLDISRQSFIVSVRRGENLLIPRGDTVLLEGDELLIYSRRKLLSDGSIYI